MCGYFNSILHNGHLYQMTHKLLFLLAAVIAEVVEVNEGNIKMLQSGPYDLILFNFYADWCHYSNHLKPVFESASNEIPKNVSDYKLLFGKIDCDRQGKLCKQYNVRKYPTIRIVKFGTMLKKEYRGARSLDGLLDFVVNSFKDPVKEISDVSELHLHTENGYFVGYFTDRNTPDFKVYKTVAWSLIEDTGVDFFAAFGPNFEKQRLSGKSLILFRPAKKHFYQDEQIYDGNLRNLDETKKWFSSVSRSFIREVNYVNAEEIMEERKALLILFRTASQHKDYDKQYAEIVRGELMPLEDKVNFLIAEGKDFQHALFHLGRSLSDLPLVALDSRKHMYMFPNVRDIGVQGQLYKFIVEKLKEPDHVHRQFIVSAGDFDIPENIIKMISGVNMNEEKVEEKVEKIEEAKPVESVFKRLEPSENRYTLLRDEL